MKSSNAQPATSLLLFGVWVVLTVPLLFLASVPISVSTQGLLALIACVLIYALKPLVGTRISIRFVVMSIAGVFVLRYWLWRAFETLPSPDDPVSLIAALILFGAETFTVGLFFLTALVTADPVTHPATRADQAQRRADGRYPCAELRREPRAAGGHAGRSQAHLVPR